MVVIYYNYLGLEVQRPTLHGALVCSASSQGP